jgi:hypothetical protein
MQTQGLVKARDPVPRGTLRSTLGESPSWLRHRILIPAYEGSNPSSPAKFFHRCRQNTKAVGLWVGVGSPYRESTYTFPLGEAQSIGL